MVPAKQDLRIMRGDTEVFNITIVDSVGSPVDLTGDIFTSQIRYDREDPTIAATFNCVITDPTEGRLSLTLPATTSAGLIPGLAFWDLQRNDSDVITTVIAGKCNILADVTR
jgi:hypothetical protein